MKPSPRTAAKNLPPLDGGETSVLPAACNICGSRVDPAKTGRDACSCSGCRSTARNRTVIHALSVSLFGESLCISDFPSRDLVGVGMSDWCFDGLERIGYQNTFYDKEPRLDILDPPEKWIGACDFIICSDVLEHVAPPIDRAFNNLFRLLRPGGLLVFSVPYVWEGETKEHFPNFHEWQIVGDKLVNVTKDGRREVFDDLVFHTNQTLRMRVFSHGSLVRHLEEVGFTDITDWEAVDECWTEPDSFPITARKGGR